MTRIRSSLYGLALAFLLVNTTHMSVYADVVVPPHVMDTVAEVYEGGTIRLEDGTLLRLWGVLPNSTSLRELVVGKEVNCKIVGLTRDHRRETTVASCLLRKQNGSPSKDVAEALLEMGKAEEFCAESGNWFDNCN